MINPERITDRELRDAYKRAGLWRIGMSYERAITVPAIHTAMSCSARAARRRAEKTGNPFFFGEPFAQQ